MSDLKLNASHQLDLTGGDVSLVTGQEAIKQEILIALRIVQGEWFLDRRVGIPYFTRFLGAEYSETVVLDVYARALRKIPGVKSVESISVEEPDANRMVSVQAEVLTVGDERISVREEFII